jgi:hypothetical protein
MFCQSRIFLKKKYRSSYVLALIFSFGTLLFHCNANAGLLGDSSYDDCVKSLTSKYPKDTQEGYIEKVCRKRYPAMPKLDDRGDTKFICKNTADEKDIFYFTVIDDMAELRHNLNDPNKIEFKILVRKNNAFALKSILSQKIERKDVYIVLDVNTGNGKGIIYFAANDQNPVGITKLQCSE